METSEKTYEHENPLKADLEGPLYDDFLAGDQWFDIDISQDFLDFVEPYRPPRYTLRRFDVSFANVGELHIISGKPGHGKTGLMSILIASILCGKYGNTEYALQSERPRPIVLYIDTEQGKDDTIAFKNRVCTMAGLDYTKPIEQFKILRLRETESAQDRWRKILKSVWMVRPTDIFLDGVLDVVKDYNDQVECQPIVRKCMNLADHFDSSFWVVLHENPMVDKLVGVLGSIFQRKVAEIFTLRKVKQSELKQNERDSSLPPIYFVVKQVKARGRDVDDWKFEYMLNAAGWGIPSEINAPENLPEPESAKKDNRPTDEEVKEAVMVIGHDTLSKTSLRQKICGKMGCGSARAGYFIELGIALGYLLKDGDKYAASENLLDDMIRFEQDSPDPF